MDEPQTYLIDYRIANARQEEKIADFLKSHQAWARITETLWAVRTAAKAADIRDAIVSKISENDRVFVIRSGTEAAWSNVRCRDEWLRKNL